MSRLFLLLVLAMAAFVAADNVIAADEIDLFEADNNTVVTQVEVADNNTLQIIKSSHVCPPFPHIGQACPKSNLFFYYKCCGEQNKACCKQRQEWILGFFLLGFFLLLILLFVLFACLRAYK